MPDERPISEKKYGINKHRFLELKHHCLQYQDWRRELANMQDTVKAIQYGKEGNLIPLCHDCHDRAHKRIKYKPKKKVTEERW